MNEEVANFIASETYLNTPGRVNLAGQQKLSRSDELQYIHSFPWLLLSFGRRKVNNSGQNHIFVQETRPLPSIAMPL
jgi:hypothetical protein